MPYFGGFAAARAARAASRRGRCRERGPASPRARPGRTGALSPGGTSRLVGKATEQTSATRARLATWFEIGKTGGAARCNARGRPGGTPKGARGGREEAPEVAGPNREEDADQAQATEEDLARQVVGSSAGSSATIG